MTMTDKYLVEPDVGFIQEMSALGGADLKKCFQCATCSVVCPISPDNKPFPRKEMIAASWGLKDRLVANGDIWLCHQCGDCSTKCPRGARPGDVLAALRAYAVAAYAKPKWLADAFSDPKKLPILFAIPIVIFLVIGLITGWLNFSPEPGIIAQAKFFHYKLVQAIFVPVVFLMLIGFALSLKKYLADMHAEALAQGKTDKEKIDFKDVLPAIKNALPTILKHDKFSECSENKDRATAHLMVFYAFVGLAIVTGIFFIVLDVFHIEGPYSQLNPVKWLANVSGIVLVIGAGLMIKNRLAKKDQVSTYKDWLLLGLVLGVGLSGLLTETIRLAGGAYLTYFFYFVHLTLVFILFISLPYSKFAHIVYRSLAMIYTEYIGRK
jgi:quinone-modifying oxidoreductase subunit QmoC